MTDVTRREALKLLAAAGVTAAAAPGCSERQRTEPLVKSAGPEAIIAVARLGDPWQTRDPFIACMHHDDRYPAGNESLGPAASLAGRKLGRDFSGRDGWRMYHGRVVPGFPQHPHRGFETVTVVRRGLLDHSDSLGAAARYGGGDVQWLTAGKGIQHAEMFPLLNPSGENPLELFQLWLNLPSSNKFAEPHFSMLWSHTIPKRVVKDAAGRETELTIVAGSYRDAKAPPPPPNSWAAMAESDVAIWTLKLAAQARWSLPAAAAGANRSLYFFRGTSLRVGGREIPPNHQIELRAEAQVELENGPDESELLLLQGRPIGEPVVQYGPFVMNTREQIQQAYADYEATRFGGWPWASNDPVHGREQGRFARLIDGRVERPT